jgi:branched-subunit amino acid transport protein AzlD
MQLTDKVIFASILIVSTQLTRLIPVLFEEKIGRVIQKESLKSLINDVLFMLLIFYCFRDLAFNSEYYLRLVVGLYIFVIQYKYEKNLLSIFTGTFFYMLGRYLI